MTLREILTPREMQYARLVADCYGNREIATKLSVSRSFVKYKLKNIYEKLGVGFRKGGARFEPRIMLAIRFDRENRS